MLGWIYQLLLSFVSRILSWFGVSFGAKELGEAVEAVESVESVALNQQKDEPQEPDQQGPVAYSEEAQQALP